MRWDTLAELTFGAAVGRTLERTRVATVGVDLEALERACEIALRRIREDFGELREIDEPSVRSLALGVLRRMRERGAVESPMFAGYLGSGGNPYAIRDVALQDFGPRSSLPVFPAPAGDRHGVEALAGTRRSWYQLWVEKVLTPVNVLAATRNAADVLHVVMGALSAAGLITELPARRTNSVGAGPRAALRHCANRRHAVRAIVAEARCPGPARPRCGRASPASIRRLRIAMSGGNPDVRPGRETSTGKRTFAASYPPSTPRWCPGRSAIVSRSGSRRRTSSPGSRTCSPPRRPSSSGVDIGDLSTVVMCSVPPAPVNYVQRTGRAGRRDGNALALTVATGQPHDLYYYAEPMEMLGSRVEPPGIFLNAPAVLERQLTAFCLDCWVAAGVDESARRSTACARSR